MIYEITYETPRKSIKTIRTIQESEQAARDWFEKFWSDCGTILKIEKV